MDQRGCEYIITDDGFDTIYNDKVYKKYIKLSDNYEQIGESTYKYKQQEITNNKYLNLYLNYLEQENYKEYKNQLDPTKHNLITFHNLNKISFDKYLPFYHYIILILEYDSTIQVMIFNKYQNQLTMSILGGNNKQYYNSSFHLEKIIFQTSCNDKSLNQVKIDSSQRNLYLVTACYLYSFFKGQILNDITKKNIDEFLKQQDFTFSTSREKQLIVSLNDESKRYLTIEQNFQINQELYFKYRFYNPFPEFIYHLENSMLKDKTIITINYIKQYYSASQIQFSNNQTIIVTILDDSSSFVIVLSQNGNNQLINFNENISIFQSIENQIKQKKYKIHSQFNKQVKSIIILCLFIEKIWKKSDFIIEEDFEIDLNPCDSIFDFVQRANEKQFMLIRNGIDRLSLVLKLRQFFYGKLDDDLNYNSGIKTEQSLDHDYNYSYSDYIGLFSKDGNIIPNKGISTQFKTNLDFDDEKKIVKKFVQSEQNTQEQTQNVTNSKSWSRYNQILNNADIEILHENSQRFLNSSIIDGWALYLNQQNEETFFNLSIEQAKAFRRLLVLESFFYTYLESFELSQNDIKLKFSEFIKFKIDIFDVYSDLCFIINKNNFHWFMIKAEKVKNIVVYTIYDSMNSFPQYYKEYTKTLDKLFIDVLGKKNFSLIRIANVVRQNDGFSCGYHVCHFLQQIHNQQTQFSKLDIRQMKNNLLNIIVRPPVQKK